MGPNRIPHLYGPHRRIQLQSPTSLFTASRRTNLLVGMGQSPEISAASLEGLPVHVGLFELAETADQSPQIEVGLSLRFFGMHTYRGCGRRRSILLWRP